MELAVGIDVLDREGKYIGTIDHLMRDAWSGEVSKYMVFRKEEGTDVVFKPEDVLETAENHVKLNMAVDDSDGIIT